MTTVTITKDMNDEYRVPGPDGREATAYYTDDRQDAKGTAINFMYKGQDIQVRFKTVEEHPEGLVDNLVADEDCVDDTRNDRNPAAAEAAAQEAQHARLAPSNTANVQACPDAAPALETVFMGMIEIELPAAALEECYHTGPCDADVDRWHPLCDFSGVTDQDLRDWLYEYGCWSDEELQDRVDNEKRALWLLAIDWQEEQN